MMGSAEKITTFNSWLTFARATIALSITLGAILFWGLKTALAGEFASKDIEVQVAENTRITRAVQSDVKELKNTVDSLNTNLLHDSLFSLRVQSCAASGTAKQFFEQQIQMKIDEFMHITGHAPSVPRCEDIQ